MSIHFSVQEEKIKEDFQDGGHGSHIGFMFRTIFAIFNLVIAHLSFTIYS